MQDDLVLLLIRELTLAGYKRSEISAKMIVSYVKMLNLQTLMTSHIADSMGNTSTKQYTCVQEDVCYSNEH